VDAGAPRLSEATAQAHPVQGLICVHGYSDPQEHLLPVEGLFMALDAFTATATVISRTRRAPIDIPPKFVSNSAVRAEDSARIQTFVAKAQAILATPPIVEVRVEHDLGAGFGLGSSAAVFAALTRAMHALSDRKPSQAELACLARRGSYSAAASFVGGLARIAPGGDIAVLSIPDSWRLETLIFPVAPRSVATEKASSRIHTDVIGSPYYGVWKTLAGEAAHETAAALGRQDFAEFRNVIEKYVLRNLAVIMTGEDSEIPWEAGTLEHFHRLRDLRTEIGGDFGVSANSGPSVFAFAGRPSIEQLISALADQHPEVAYVRSAPGGPAELTLDRSRGEVPTGD
jgi:mevalonate pyrophosphate decarboxylase